MFGGDLQAQMSVLPRFPETNLVQSKHFVLRRAERKKKRNEWKSQQSFSKQDNLSLISYLLNESIKEQQLYVSLISFPRTRSAFYPLGSLTAKTNPRQHRMLTSLSSLSFILWIQPRLPWCSNPTRQYASLVLALINWDGGKWGGHVVSSFPESFLSCPLLIKLPADLKVYLDAFLISSRGKCEKGKRLHFASCSIKITEISQSVHRIFSIYFILTHPLLHAWS